MTMEKLRFPLDLDIEWVKCPSCKEDWSKLRTSIFYAESDSGLKKVMDNSCVECAETLKNYKWWTSRFPFVSQFSNWGDVEITDTQVKPRYLNALDERIPVYANASISVSVRGSNSTFTITCLGSGVGMEVVERLNGGTERTLHDCFPSAWSWVKKKFLESNSKNEEKIESW